MLDLARHDCLRHAGRLQQADALPELADRNPMEGGRRRSGRDVGEVGKRFFLQRDDGDVVAGAARGVEHQKREPTVASYQT